MSERTLWSLTASATAVTPVPLPPRAEVVIAGAGLTGLALAIMLAEAGLRPVVVEARSVGGLTTGRTTGKLSLLQGAQYARIRDHAGDDTLRAYAESQRAAQLWMRDELRAVPEALADASAVTFALTDHGAELLEREHAALAVAGIAPSLVCTDALEGRLPFEPLAALELADQAKLHPVRVIAHLLQHALSLGATVIENCRVDNAATRAGRVRVSTTRGTIEGDHLVLATGVPVLDRGLEFARLEPLRSIVAAYRVPPGSAVPNSMMLSVDEPAISMRVDAGVDGEPMLVVGGGEHTTGRAASTRALLRELDGWTREHWPEASRRLVWAAQDYVPVDAVPHAGRLHGGRGRIWAATGYAKWGMTNAVASAIRIRGAIVGEAPWWAEALDERPQRIRSLAEASSLNARVGARLVSGWTRSLTTTREGPPPEGQGRVVRRGAQLVAESTVDGVACAVAGVCTHLGGTLAWNDLERSWDCPLHGSRFSPRGELLEGPAVTGLETVAESAGER